MRFSTLFNIGLVGSVLLTPAMAQDAKTVQDQAVEALRARISELRTQSTPVDARAARSARQRAEVKERNEARDKYQAEKRAAFEKAQKGQPASSKTRTTADAASVTTNTVSPAYQSDLEKRARQLLQERNAQQTKPAASVPPVHPPATPPQEPLSSEQLSVAQRALRQQYSSPVNAQSTPAAQEPLSPEKLSAAQRALRQQYTTPVVVAPAVQVQVQTTKPVLVAETPKPAAATKPQIETAAVKATEPSLAPEQLSAAQKALRQQYGSSTAQTPTAPAINQEAEAAAREALRRATAEPASNKAASTPSHPQAKVAKGTPEVIQQAPAGPKTKQERLAELLNLYKADKITPGQYHQQRVKIVNEP